MPSYPQQLAPGMRPGGYIPYPPAAPQMQQQAAFGGTGYEQQTYEIILNILLY